MKVGQKVKCTDSRLGCYGMVGEIVGVKPWPHHDEPLLECRMEGADWAGGIVDLRAAEVTPIGLTRQEKGEWIAAIPVHDRRVSEQQAEQIAGILGDSDSFHYFDALASGGSQLADEYGCWKVRQARNMNVDGRPVFFDALKALATS